MPEEFAQQPGFERRLQTEVDRVLTDPVFRRSPVLSRLLGYLRDKTIRPLPSALTQFAIAVEGLGRRADYDQDAESYARVQISRLRKSLAEYYARNQPGEGLCVFLRHGDYTLRLAPRERAYPEQHKAPEPPLALADDRAFLAGGGPTGPARSYAPLLAVLAAGAIVMALWALVKLLPIGLAREEPVAGPPKINVAVKGADALSSGLGEAVSMEIRRTLATSFVSRASDSPKASYSLLVDFGANSRQRPQALLRLVDRNDFTLFTQSLPLTDDREEFLQRLDRALEEVFSTSGVLATHLAQKADPERPGTDFECFLVIETGRASGNKIWPLLDQCMRRFPRSSYNGFWHARRAFILYQEDILKGSPVRRNSGGWNSLTRAFEIDRYNPYANAVAAKVELAEGDCSQARVHFARVSERSMPNPVLEALLTTEMLPCFSEPAERAEWEEVLSDTIAAHQDPEPQLRVYLVLAALELGRPETARTILQNAISSPRSQGTIASALNALNKTFGLVPGSKPDRRELEKWIQCFIWNPKAQQAILRGLDKGAKQPS